MELKQCNKARPSDCIDKLFQERNDFILIGLTGRTGSGCTTVSKILAKQNFDSLLLPPPYETNFTSADQRKYRVIYNYLNVNWAGFRTISMTAVISIYILQEDFDQIKNFLVNIGFSTTDNAALYQELRSIYNSKKTNELKKLIKSNIDERNRLYHIKEKYSDTLEIYENTLIFWQDLKKILEKYFLNSDHSDKKAVVSTHRSSLYSTLYQFVGNNIREFGYAFQSKSSEQTAKIHMFDLACRTNDIIQAYRLHDKNNSKFTHICIDAIRNPFEAMFFQDRYSAFYLVSVNTSENERLNRLSDLSKSEIQSLDFAEYPKNLKGLDSFIKLDIASCIQLSDIHLDNPNCETNPIDNPELTIQIARYVCLMMHPGLVTPTAVERCMQVAYNAKLNSGCLSRQVGAVITDKDFSIKAIGWNDVASGQIPCNLRDIRALCQYHDRSSHSRFELENSNFHDFMSRKYSDIDYSKLKGRLYPYCFSEMYNQEVSEELNEESEDRVRYVKNQVYTRSLHAEENAFLQITKYGGEGIQGGNLFVTASPCELCSKKSYQLGIRNIYYIDPYPGIAKEHIIDFNRDKELNPSLHVFTGAVGRAYTLLYVQKISYKDELASMID